MARSTGASLRTLVAVALLAAAGCGYNEIQRLDEEVGAAWAEVGNQYQRRADLIPNLVSTVQGAADFERETLQGVIEARAKATQIAITPELVNDPEAFRRFEQAQGQLGSALSRLLVAVERYPQLQALQSFQQLQAQIEGTENRIAVARRRYIETVARYNTLVRSFPSNLTARFLANASVKSTFEARPGTEQAPVVEF